MKKKQTTRPLTLVSVKSLALALILGPVSSLSVNAYQLVDLGSNVAPKAISNTGIVVGASNTDQYPTTAFSWSDADGPCLLWVGIFNFWPLSIMWYS